MACSGIGTRMSSLSFNMSELMSHPQHHPHPHHLAGGGGGDPDMDVGHADTTEVLLTLLSQNKMLGGKFFGNIMAVFFFFFVYSEPQFSKKVSMVLMEWLPIYDIELTSGSDRCRTKPFVSPLVFFLNGPFPASFSLFSSFQNTVDSKQMFDINNFLPMTGFELRTSSIGSNHSIN